MAPCVIWGAQGHAKVLQEFLPRIGYRVVAVVDRDPQVLPPFDNVPLLFGDDGLRHWLEDQPNISALAGFAAVGGNHGGARQEILSKLRSWGLHTPSIQHPHSYVANSTSAGDGCQFLAGSVVGTDASLGEACIINTNASIDHECSLGDGVHVAPGSTLTGCIHLEDRVFIGAGSVVLPRITIGSDTVVGAGSVVTRDLPSGVVAYGSPARVVRENTS